VNNWQFLTLLIVPMAMNGLTAYLLSNRISALESRFSALEARVEHGFEMLAGRVNDLADRLARNDL